MNKSVMKCCICNNERIGEFITINNKKYHLCCIEQLHKENQSLKEQVQQENKKYKEIIDKAINNSQYWIDYYTRLNSDERIALRLQENIDILKEVK